MRLGVNSSYFGSRLAGDLGLAAGFRVHSFVRNSVPLVG